MASALEVRTAVGVIAGNGRKYVSEMAKNIAGNERFRRLPRGTFPQNQQYVAGINIVTRSAMVIRAGMTGD